MTAPSEVRREIPYKMGSIRDVETFFYGRNSDLALASSVTDLYDAMFKALLTNATNQQAKLCNESGCNEKGPVFASLDLNCNDIPEAAMAYDLSQNIEPDQAGKLESLLKAALVGACFNVCVTCPAIRTNAKCRFRN